MVNIVHVVTKRTPDPDKPVDGKLLFLANDTVPIELRAAITPTVAGDAERHAGMGGRALDTFRRFPLGMPPAAFCSFEQAGPALGRILAEAAAQHCGRWLGHLRLAGGEVLAPRDIVFQRHSRQRPGDPVFLIAGSHWAGEEVQHGDAPTPDMGLASIQRYRWYPKFAGRLITLDRRL